MAQSREAGDSYIDAVDLDEILVEDEFGYVDEIPSSNTISRRLVMQLPSNQIDEPIDVPDACTLSSLSEKRKKTLKRSETRYKTTKMRRVAFTSKNIDDDAEKAYELLMADPNAEEAEIRSDLKDLYQSLTVKRMVKDKIDSNKENQRRLESLDCCSRLHYQFAMLWEKIKVGVKDLSYSMELWQGAVKRIQGHSGSGISSYFIFLRWLFYLNIFNFLVPFGFMVTPQLIYDNLSDSRSMENLTFSGFDLLTASGWLGNSSFFYGHYTNKTIEIVDNHYYNMPLAYLSTVAIVAVVNLFVVAYSATKAYQANYIDSSGEINKVCGKVFCAWDFGIEKPDTADLRHRLIYQELKDFLSHEMEAKSAFSCLRCLLNVCISFVVNLFVLSSIAAIGYLVYFMLDNRALEVDIRILQLMTLSLTITSISFIFHYVIWIATKLEYYLSKQTQLYFLLGRVAVLRIVILSVLVYFWLVVYVPGPGDARCYESLLGEEIYRLILVNFLTNLLFRSLLGEFLRRVMSKDLRCIKGYITLAEFDVAYNTNDLIYYQTLIWVGGFFSPMLPLMLLIILFLLFYIKLHSVLRNCRPSQKPFSSTESHIVYLVLTLANFLMACIAVGYTIFRIKPSSSCGPFRNHNTMYGILPFILNLSEKQDLFLTQIVKYAGSSGFVFTLVLSLCVAVYYARAQSIAYEKLVAQVREQLIKESKDKALLLHLFNAAYKDHLNNRRQLQFCDEDDYDPYDKNEKLSKSPIGCKSSNEILNEAYQDYPSDVIIERNMSPSSAMAKYNPGYMLADVPANNIAGIDEMVDLKKQRLSNDSGDSQIVFKQDDRSRASSSSDSTQGGKRQRKLVLRPVHKRGFQYSVRADDDSTPDDGIVP